MAVSIAWHIILEGVNDQITFNMIDFEDSKKMWNKFKIIYNKIRQSIIYLIL